MKLLIGIPTGGRPTRPFLDALGALVLPAGVTGSDRLVWTGNFVAAQREMIVRAAVERGFDVVAMIDDDIVAPPDALQRLVEALDADPAIAVAGALYYSRDGARPMVVSRWDPADTTTAAIPAFSSTRITPADGVGFGCVAIRVAPLRALAPPLFAAHLYVDEATRTVRQCDEDYLFCRRLRDAGLGVVVHGGVRAGHYDRASERVYPLEWENDAETDRERMIVAGPEGSRLVPFDGGVGRITERQERFPATLLRATSP